MIFQHPVAAGGMNVNWNSLNLCFPLAGLDIEYKTIQYDCISVPKGALAYTDECHSDLPASGPTRALLLETFEVRVYSISSHNKSSCKQCKVLPKELSIKNNNNYLYYIYHYPSTCINHKQCWGSLIVMAEEVEESAIYMAEWSWSLVHSARVLKTQVRIRPMTSR